MNYIAARFHASACLQLDWITEALEQRPRPIACPVQYAQVSVLAMFYILIGIVGFGEDQMLRELLGLRMAFYAYE